MGIIVSSAATLEGYAMRLMSESAPNIDTQIDTDIICRICTALSPWPFSDPPPGVKCN